MNVLQKIKQSESETVDSFYMRIKAAVSMLSPETMSQAELIELLTLSQLVNNCTITAKRKKALKDGLKLRDFPDNTRAYELTEAQTQEIEKSSSGMVNATRKRFQHHQKGKKNQNPANHATGVEETTHTQAISRRNQKNARIVASLATMRKCAEVRNHKQQYKSQCFVERNKRLSAYKRKRAMMTPTPMTSL